MTTERGPSTTDRPHKVWQVWITGWWIRRLMRVQRDMRIDCQNLAGHEHDLIVFGDRGRCVLVFPPGAWAVLVRSQVERLRAALIIGDGTRNTA